MKLTCVEATITVGILIGKVIPAFFVHCWSCGLMKFTVSESCNPNNDCPRDLGQLTRTVVVIRDDCKSSKYVETGSV